jgi:hypothetical protein
LIKCESIGKTVLVMERNAAHVTDYCNLPGEQVVEIGRLAI